jgi:5'(3')-deoxyribonucleotidase
VNDPVCYLDMDGVIADFTTGAIRLHGLEGRVGVKDLDWEHKVFLKFGKPSCANPAFWEGMGHDYWAGLPKTDEADVLVRGLRQVFGGHNIVILTSPCMTPGCVEGKREWLDRHFPDYSRSVFFGSAKHMLAGRGKVLLDDNNDNFSRFNLCGGSAILVPRPWNDRRSETTGDGGFDVADLLEKATSVRANLIRGK